MLFYRLCAKKVFGLLFQLSQEKTCGIRNCMHVCAHACVWKMSLLVCIIQSAISVFLLHLNANIQFGSILTHFSLCSN